MFQNKKVHLIGIGGISMSGIAEILKANGAIVTGYDAKESDITKRLNNDGIKVTYKENLDNVKNADIIVYTAAIKEDNKELSLARSLNKEIYERGVFLGIMMKEYKNVLCISGTHGKSTTTGMVSTIFVKNNLNPTIQIGANLPLINGNYQVGGNEYFIVEACEYVDSFLNFFPTSEIILNIDSDHLDYFKNLDNIINSFKRYTNLIPEDGYLIINNDDENSIIASKDFKNKTTYGINNISNYMAKNIEFDEYGHPSYDLYIDNNYIDKVILNVNGLHNVYNSLAAISLSHKYISDIKSIINALKDYNGVGRRFEYLGKYNDALIYDDYAHHPSEIETCLNSVKATKHEQDYAIFQSHTFSRTKDHLKQFAKVLSKFDNVIIAKIYPAREENIYNVHEEDLVNLIKENGNHNVIYIDEFEKIENYIKENVKPNDLVISIGAGPVNEITNNLVKKQS